MLLWRLEHIVDGLLITIMLLTGKLQLIYNYNIKDNRAAAQVREA